MWNLYALQNLPWRIKLLNTLTPSVFKSTLKITLLFFGLQHNQFKRVFLFDCDQFAFKINNNYGCNNPIGNKPDENI